MVFIPGYSPARFLQSNCQAVAECSVYRPHQQREAEDLKVASEKLGVNTLAELRAVSAEKLLEVFGLPEWKGGHIPDAELHPLDSLGAAVATMDRSHPPAVHCKSGYRSAIACSVMEAAGLPDPVNVIGGFDAWTAAGFPVET